MTKRKPGRKPESPDGATRKFLQIRASDAEKAAIRATADRLGADMSEAVRQLPRLEADHRALLTAVLGELRGVFDPPELNLILDAMRDVALTPEMIGQHLHVEVAGGIRGQDRLELKWGVAPAQILDKIESLDLGRRAAVELWASEMWRRCGDEAAWERGMRLLLPST